VTTTETVPRSLQISRASASVVGGLLAFAIALGISAGLVAWGHTTYPDSDDGSRERLGQVLPVPAGAGIAALSFQRVPFTVEREELSGGQFRGPERIRYRGVISLLGGLLLVGLALVVGGAVAHRMDKQRGAFRSGLGVALVFAAACFVLSFLVPLAESLIPAGPNAGRGSTITFRPSPIGALIWPFIWGLVFGSLGAFIGKHGRGWRRELVTALEARTTVATIALRATARGIKAGLAMFMLAAVLTAGFGIALHVEGTRDVLGSSETASGIAEGIIVGLPHAAGAGLVGSMGIPVRYEVTDHVRKSTEQFTVGIFGGEGQRQLLPGATFSGRPGENSDVPVPGYALGGLLIAVGLTVATGYRAAALSEDKTGTIGSVIAAAMCLTVFLWIIAYLVGVRLDVTLLEPECCSGAQATLAPSQFATILVTPAWAIGGGFVGAWLHARRRGTAAL
jgi:hypothetical protein